MKNLFAFTAFLAAGFLLGSRRARKAGPVNVISCAVEVDTSQALKAVEDLQQRITTVADMWGGIKPVTCQFSLCAADLMAVGGAHNYRNRSTN